MKNILTKIILSSIVLLILSGSSSALVFNNFSFGGVAGSVNTGNGYFDDDAAAYGYSGSRNIYVVAEPTEIWMFEPSCLSSGCTNFDAFESVNSSTGLLHDAVVYRGFLYFVDGTTLKKRDSRAITNVVESTDDSAGGTVTVLSTGVGESLRVYNDVLYFTKGQNGIYHLDDEDNEVFDFTMSKLSTGAQIKSFTPFINNSILHIYTSYGTVGVETRVVDCTSSACNNLYSGSLPAQIVPTADTFYSTATKIYGLTINTGNNGQLVQCMYLVSNGSCTTSTIITDTSIDTSRRAYVGSRSTIGLLANAATYSTFNSAEVGFDSLPAELQPDLTYDLIDLTSVQTSYYNNTNIQISEAIQLQFVDNILLWGDVSTNYRWRVDLIDPNSIAILSFTTGACNGLLSCRVTNVITFQPPDINWTAGTYRAKLYEVNIVTGSSALLITSDTFTVLNTSSTGGSVAPGTGGSGGTGGGLANTQTALNLISVFSLTAFWGFVIWLGIIGSVIITMSKNPSGVNGIAVIVVAWLSAIMIALVGLFDPFKIYIIVMSTIIAAVLFKYGRSATTEG